MTPKQAKYIENRIAGLPPREAAVQAGYEVTGAKQAACAMEKRADVQSAIKKGRKVAPKEGKGAGGRQSASKRAENAMEDGGVDPDNYLRDHYDSPLDLLLHVCNEPRAPKGVRIECAKIAAPYVHGKAAPDEKVGKKKQQENRAKELSKGGRYSRRSAPRSLHHVN